MDDLLSRIKTAGYKALVITLDIPVGRWEKQVIEIYRTLKQPGLSLL